MHEIPQIFDQRLRRLRRTRAALQPASMSFLADTATEELAERIASIKRNFVTPICYGVPLSQSLSPHPWTKADSIPQLIGRNGLVFDEGLQPFARQSIDIYVSVLSLHTINDLPGALSQIRTCLKPDGLFLAALFGGQTLSELRRVLSQAEIEIDGGLSPRIAPFADIRDAGALLQRAGFALPVADADKIVVRYETPFTLLADLRAMGETNMLVERRKTFLKRKILLRAMDLYAEQFTGADGRVSATFEIIYLAGWAPHESQQQPLKRGSAQVPLAQALKAIRD